MIGIFGLIGLVSTHYQAIAGALLILQLICVGIVNFTDTPEDDRLYAKFYKAIEAMAGIITAKAKR